MGEAEKKPKLIEKMTITISNRKGVIGDKAWCIDGTRLDLAGVAQVLDLGGIKQLLEYYPHIKDDIKIIKRLEQ